MGAKRICLFAGYNATGKVDDCVFCYLRELQKFADICYFADGELPPADKEKLKEYTLAAYGARHGKYDFGSWAELMRLLGEEKLAEYDELILANDSCFGGFASFQPMFAEMEKEHSKLWYKWLNDGKTPDLTACLETALEKEQKDIEGKCEEFAQKAEEEGFGHIAGLFRNIENFEMIHMERLKKAIWKLKDDVKPNPDGTFNWVCSVCGAMFQQTEEPDYCPLCVKENVFFYKKPD